LKRLHKQVKSHQKMQEERITDDLRIEEKRRTMVEEEIVEDVTWICTDIEEFLNKQLPKCIQEGVKSGLQSLHPPVPPLTMEQIQEVVHQE
jgi:hypothetical protein